MPHIREYCDDDDAAMALMAASGVPLATEEHHLGLVAEVNQWACWARAHSRIIERAHLEAREALLNAQSRDIGPVGYVASKERYMASEHTPPIEIRQYNIYQHNTNNINKNLVRFKVMFYYTPIKISKISTRGVLISKPTQFTKKKDVPTWLDRLITDTFMDTERPFRKRFDPAVGLLGLPKLPITIENNRTSKCYGVAVGTHLVHHVEQTMFPRHLTPWVVHMLRMALRPIAEEMIQMNVYCLDYLG